MNLLYKFRFGFLAVLVLLVVALGIWSKKSAIPDDRFRLTVRRVALGETELVFESLEGRVINGWYAKGPVESCFSDKLYSARSNSRVAHWCIQILERWGMHFSRKRGIAKRMIEINTRGYTLHNPVNGVVQSLPGMMPEITLPSGDYPLDQMIVAGEQEDGVFLVLQVSDWKENNTGTATMPRGDVRLMDYLKTQRERRTKSLEVKSRRHQGKK